MRTLIAIFIVGGTKHKDRPKTASVRAAKTTSCRPFSSFFVDLKWDFLLVSAPNSPFDFRFRTVDQL